MTALLPWIAVIVTIVAGWALLKRYSTHMVLLFSRPRHPHLRRARGRRLPPEGREDLGLLALRHLRDA